MADRVTGGHDRGEKVDRAQGDGDAIGEPGAGAAVPGCGAGGQGVADEALARPVAGGEVGQRNPAGGGVEAGLSAGPQPSDEGPRGVGAHADSRCGGQQVADFLEQWTAAGIEPGQGMGERIQVGVDQDAVLADTGGGDRDDLAVGAAGLDHHVLDRRQQRGCVDRPTGGVAWRGAPGPAGDRAVLREGHDFRVGAADVDAADDRRASG